MRLKRWRLFAETGVRLLLDHQLLEKASMTLLRILTGHPHSPAFAACRAAAAHEDSWTAIILRRMADNNLHESMWQHLVADGTELRLQVGAKGRKGKAAAQTCPATPEKPAAPPIT